MILPLRRTAIPIAKGKMSQTISFYKSVLEMKLFYDEILEVEPAVVGIEGPVRARVVVLQQTDSTIGMIGFNEYIEPDIEIKPLQKEPGKPYPVMLIFNTDQVEEIYERAVTNGAEVPLPPKEYVLPGRGKGKVAIFIDPNGIAIEVSQWESYD